ncbi:MAG: NTP transferase domain-containing protein [Clostridium sp.]|uniref:NTP transferase domain-containing protein n=1 Tax=Clostridium sp. TaxID=1506 RepID=UPI003048BAED
MISGIIMASGLSVRMGKCKLLLKYKEKFLIEYVLDAVKESNFNYKTVITGNEKIIELSEARELNVVMNNSGSLGQSESIKLGILNSPSVSGYGFITADQPFISVDILNKLIAEFENYPSNFIVPMYKGKRGSPVIFPERYKDELLCLSGDLGGKVILKKYEDNIRFVEISDGYPLWDIDTEEDYIKLLKSNYP